MTRLRAQVISVLISQPEAALLAIGTIREDVLHPLNTVYRKKLREQVLFAVVLE